MQSSDYIDSEDQPVVPSSCDEAPFRGFGHEPCSWAVQMSGTSVSTDVPWQSDLPSEDDKGQVARVFCALARIQEQLDKLLEGQAELRCTVDTFASVGGKSPMSPAKRKQTGDDSDADRCGTLLLSDIQIGEPLVVEPISPTTPRARPRLLRQSSKISYKSAGSQHKPMRWNGKKTGADTPVSSTSRSTKMSHLLRRSRSAFDGLRTADEDKDELRIVFEHAEEIEDKLNEEKSLMDQLREMNRQQLEMLLDSVIGILIVCNAVFIGVSLDATPEQGRIIFAIDLFFSVAFISELLIKLCVNGFNGQFRGENRLMNIFDASLIAIDLLQLSLQVLYPDATNNMANMPSASLFRVVRLCKLVRILRLLRHPVLQTLLMMMHGMIGGLPTLGWALLLFMFSVYIVALLCREFLGRQEEDHTHSYFSDVPRAMITTFRCSFGDCTDLAGTPIFEHVDKKHGIGFSVFYCLFAFTMSIGMFNVISAIFVQSTLAAATGMKAKQKKARLQDDVLWATRVNAIVRKIASTVLDLDETERLSEHTDMIYDLDVSCDTMDRIGMDPVVRAALEELDVDAEDHECLSEILDVDQNGSVVVIELLQAIRRLRGNPRRSDIVSVDLLCRSIQSTLKEMQQSLTEGFQKVSTLTTPRIRKDCECDSN
eukprot:TRINITY_DN6111_c0_g2_i1.p1 TRINITY_DN6111_c0_g2~~TRINITY_DN6111_c0_g2_i1.p1  ORF type:complete len:655 (-),score=105.85 TRINITY_DN6111_c0_g2_i1:201-2165(-)